MAASICKETIWQFNVRTLWWLNILPQVTLEIVTFRRVVTFGWSLFLVCDCPDIPWFYIYLKSELSRGFCVISKTPETVLYKILKIMVQFCYN